jgi:hypothetical protein
MKPVTVSVDVARSRDDVYAFLDVLGNHEAFTDHFLVDWQLEGPASGVGAGVKMQAKVAGRKEPVELVVKDAEAPRRIVEQTVAAGGKRRTRGTYILSELGRDRTHVEFELAIEAQPAYEKPLSPLTRAYMRKLNGRAMERLRELLESAPATG